jgi:hypothetical protein
MLVGNVLTWFIVYLVFLGGWAVATYIAVVMSDSPRASTPCAAGTQVSCFTGTKVQILMLQAPQSCILATFPWLP